MKHPDETSTERARVVSVAPKTAEAEVRGHRLVVDKPPELGGTDRGIMASEHVLVALGGCMCQTVRRIADVRKVPLAHVEFEAQMGFDDRGEVVRVEIFGRVRSGAPRADVEKVLELSARACTISKLLGDRVTKSWTVEPA